MSLSGLFTWAVGGQTTRSQEQKIWLISNETRLHNSRGTFCAAKVKSTHSSKPTFSPFLRSSKTEPSIVNISVKTTKSFMENWGKNLSAELLREPLDGFTVVGNNQTWRRCEDQLSAEHNGHSLHNGLNAQVAAWPLPTVGAHCGILVCWANDDRAMASPCNLSLNWLSCSCDHTANSKVN